MKLKVIQLDDDEQPEKITVEMSLAEAQWIATAAGVGSFNDAKEAYGEELARVAAGMYADLTGGLFNLFWEDGLHGVGRE